MRRMKPNGPYGAAFERGCDPILCPAPGRASGNQAIATPKVQRETERGSTMRLTMVGTGYVGLVTGVCFANTGNDVICLDVDARKIEKLRQGVCPIYEPGLTELMARNYESGRLRYTLDKEEAYR